MIVELGPELEALIEEKVRSGRYRDASEVVRESLQLLDARDRHERLKRAVAVGDEQFARGEAVKWTSETMKELQQEADEEDRLNVRLA
jgi:antitoxin ParD1/3/4